MREGWGEFCKRQVVVARKVKNVVGGLRGACRDSYVRTDIVVIERGVTP
jgi:hypothetical protein